MAKPKQTSFSEEFEPILLSAWGSNKNRLDEALVFQTRKAIAEIRKYYRFKDVFPSKIQYKVAKNRAGYLASFGQRHAYLSYVHLKKIEGYNPVKVPNHDSRAELTVTILGAGAALEVYGLCLYYCEYSYKLKSLRLNLIEKVAEWQPTRNIVLHQWIKRKFPKLNIQSVDIEADLTKDCLQIFAQHYDQLANTDILIIYNVFNEIDVKYAEKVWRNVNWILKNCDKGLLVLLMEPSVRKAIPRVYWPMRRLSECCKKLLSELDDEIQFNSLPTKIEYEGTGVGLNDRLFSPIYTGGASNPSFQTSLKRAHLACVKDPHSPIKYEDVQKQLEQLRIRRGKAGRFAPQKPLKGEQGHFSALDSTFPV